MTAIGTDFRRVDGATTAWFDARSLVDAAALAAHIVELAPDAAIDLRSTGVRVRLATDEPFESVSAAARQLGLAANPDVLQSVGVVFDAADAAAVQSFWQPVLAYTAAGDELHDPLWRDPAIRFRQSDERRPLRNRVHLDVVRPGSTVEQLGLGEGTGPYDVRHIDPEGNEVDLVPGDGLGTGGETSDWAAVFGAMACYRTTSPELQRDLASAVAELADAAGFPLLIDLRPGLVVLDSGKDQWEAEAHGLDVDFVALAGRIQNAAQQLGATAEAALPRFVQLFIDAADVGAIREFWVVALEYTRDRRSGATDIHDPRRLNPVLVFQELDAADDARRRQRNRIHFELAVPSDVAHDRIAAMVAAGGRVLDQSTDGWRIADPEGNELAVVTR